MGQQQLLLVILVTIIVGIATVVAINIFGTAAEQANIDAVRQDLLSAATQAQAVYVRPVLMGGAGGTFNNTTPEQVAAVLNIPGFRDGAVITNDNAVYTVTAADGDAMAMSALAASTNELWLLDVAIANGIWTITITDPDNNAVTSTTGAPQQ